jgi:hypothetical protein
VAPWEKGEQSLLKAAAKIPGPSCLPGVIPLHVLIGRDFQVFGARMTPIVSGLRAPRATPPILIEVESELGLKANRCEESHRRLQRYSYLGRSVLRREKLS